MFQCVRRQELDVLQIVNRRFSAIVEKKLTLVCLRQLKSAKISRCSVQRQFVLVVEEVGAEKKNRLPTGVDNERAATGALLKACQSSRVDSLELYGKTPLSVDFIDSLAILAPTIFVKDFCLGKRTLDENVELEEVLRALQAFAGLKTVKGDAGIHPLDNSNEKKEKEVANLQDCLIRACFKAGVTLVFGELGLNNNVIVENALIEYCLGACDEQYAERDRFLSVEFLEPLKRDFLQRWIEVSGRCQPLCNSVMSRVSRFR